MELLSAIAAYLWTPKSDGEHRQRQQTNSERSKNCSYLNIKYMCVESSSGRATKHLESVCTAYLCARICIKFNCLQMNWTIQQLSIVGLTSRWVIVFLMCTTKPKRYYVVRVQATMPFHRHTHVCVCADFHCGGACLPICFFLSLFSFRFFLQNNAKHVMAFVYTLHKHIWRWMKLRIEISFRLKRIYRIDIACACNISICIIHKMKWNKILNCKIGGYCCCWQFPCVIVSSSK